LGVVQELIRTIQENAIDVVIIDPFVSSHQVSENDNTAIDRVVKLCAKIAEVTGCAVELVHHVRKTGGNEVTVEDGRGAVALLAAARSARVLNRMSETEAASAGVEKRGTYFRIDNGKANLAPPPERTHWCKLESVDLENGTTILDLNGSGLPLNLGGGDHVGVVTEWEWPNPLDQVTVADLRAVQDEVAKGRWRQNAHISWT
jgi:hypothetical protein